MPKPADFYVSIIDFFGVLLPGAVMTYLYGPRLLQLMNVSDLTGPAVAWSAFLITSYIVGQLLLGVGVHLNELVSWYKPKKHDKFYWEVRKDVESQLPEVNSRKDMFYRVHAYLRLESAPAVAEIDRQMAEYKLFRGLAIVFAFDLVIALSTRMPLGRILLSAVICALALWRFAFLLHWTYRTAFEYYILVKLRAGGRGAAGA